MDSESRCPGRVFYPSEQINPLTGGEFPIRVAASFPQPTLQGTFPAGFELCFFLDVIMKSQVIRTPHQLEVFKPVIGTIIKWIEKGIL
jgi:hypothetical protein